jgi:hypothetical protein
MVSSIAGLRAGAVGKAADQHAAERAEDVADAERAQRKQQAGERCRCRKERLADIDGKEGVGREIEELQSIAQDSCNDDLLGKTWFQRRPISADKRGAVLIARGRCVKTHPDMPHRSVLS